LIIAARLQSNNNDDLLKYASLIIITDNRGGKRGSPLAVKHSFAAEFLTSRRIFNTWLSLPPSLSLFLSVFLSLSLGKALITILPESRAISQDTRPKASSTFV